MVFTGILFLGLGASGPVLWGLWLLGHKPPISRAFSMAGGAHGWVAGRAGFWGALATWVGVSSSSPQVPGHPTSMCDIGVKGLITFREPKKCYIKLLHLRLFIHQNSS